MGKRQRRRERAQDLRKRAAESKVAFFSRIATQKPKRKRSAAPIDT